MKISVDNMEKQRRKNDLHKQIRIIIEIVNRESKSRNQNQIEP